MQKKKTSKKAQPKKVTAIRKPKRNKTNSTRSAAAKKVAKDVVKAIKDGKKPNKQKIQMKHGYSKSSAKAMKATKTKAYKETIKPVVEKMQERVGWSIEAMTKEKLKKTKAVDLANVIDKLQRNIELLSGRDTSRVGGLVDDIYDRL